MNMGAFAIFVAIQIFTSVAYSPFMYAMLAHSVTEQHWALSLPGPLLS